MERLKILRPFWLIWLATRSIETRNFWIMSKTSRERLPFWCHKTGQNKRLLFGIPACAGGDIDRCAKANAAYWRGRLKPYGKVLTVDLHSVLHTDMLLRRLITFGAARSAGSDASKWKFYNAAYRFQRVIQEFRRWAAEYHDLSENEVNEKQSALRTIFINDLCLTKKLSVKDDTEFLKCLEEVLRRYDVVQYGRELLLESKSIASSGRSRKVVNSGDISYPNYTNPDLMQNILEILRKTRQTRQGCRILIFLIFAIDVPHPIRMPWRYPPQASAYLSCSIKQQGRWFNQTEIDCRLFAM